MRTAKLTIGIESFTPGELQHYSRHLSLAEVGVEGQARLKAASILIVGLGGLGCPLSLYLTAAGVGRIGLVEFDTVDASNLHRQVLYGSSQVGQAKLAAAAARLRDLNPHVQIDEHPIRLTRDNARELIARYDIVADGADNFATRFLVNDACVLEDKPLVSASILGFEGQLAVFHFQGGPCYRCLYPAAPPPGAVPSCAEGGVLGVLPGILGSLQATEVIKLILGIGDPASGSLLHIDALSLDFSRLAFSRNADCPVCGDRPTITELADYDAFCGVGTGKPPGDIEVDLESFASRLKQSSHFLLIDVRALHERAVDALPNSDHIPLATLLAEGVACDRNTEIIVYCQSGARSLKATEALLGMGFENVRSLKSGLAGWRKRYPGGHS
jgi:adenylyltransferase/sulfurtransferase